MTLTKRILLFLSLIGVLFFAYALDLAVEYLKEISVESFVLTPYLWASVLADLLLAFCLLGLVRLVSGNNKSRGSALVFALAGLILMLYPALARSLPSFALPLVVAPPVEFPSRFSITTAFITVLGLISLLSGSDRSQIH